KAAAGAAALDAKEWTGRRLPEAERNVGADSSEPLRQADGARRLPLPRPRRRDRRDDDQPAIRPILQPLQGIEADLGLIRPVGDQLGLQQAECLADFHDRPEAAGLGQIEGSRRLAHVASFVGFINADRGLAASSSSTMAVATSAAEPDRSWGSPQRQPSR